MADPGREGQRFPKSLRLTRRAEFVRVQDTGRKAAADPLLGLALPNALGRTRLGITVSKKVGNAVVRARVRRHLRELFRTRSSELPRGIDLVLVARNSAKDADHAELARAFGAVAARMRSLFK